MERATKAQELFREGYNCSQSVFAAYSDLYGIDQETALKLSASFGGGLGRMREVCGAVSGMSMIAGLETGSAVKGDDAGKKYNYEVVQGLVQEFHKQSGSLICRELLQLKEEEISSATPQSRTEEYYGTRPCEQLVRDAAGIIERVLYAMTLEMVSREEQIETVARLAEEIWHEHYDSIIGKDQADYMIEHFQSCEAIRDQISQNGYEYRLMRSPGGYNGYLAYRMDPDSMFLSKLYIAKRFRGRGYARTALDHLEEICRNNGVHRICLTVNRHNEGSIRAYEKLGFVRTGTQRADIGAGYVMDDFLMEKKVEPA